MSKADRNKHMQIARDQWLTTKDGQITAKTGDVRHAYAEGFASGRKNRDGELLEQIESTVRESYKTDPEDVSGLLLAGAIVQGKKP